MERNVEMNGVIKELNWGEKILVRIFAKTFYKVYNKARVDIINTFIR